MVHRNQDRVEDSLGNVEGAALLQTSWKRNGTEAALLFEGETMKKLKTLLGLPVYEDVSLAFDLTEEPEVIDVTLYVDGKVIRRKAKLHVRRAEAMRIIPNDEPP